MSEFYDEYTDDETNDETNTNTLTFNINHFSVEKEVKNELQKQKENLDTDNKGKMNETSTCHNTNHENRNKSDNNKQETDKSPENTKILNQNTSI